MSDRSVTHTRRSPSNVPTRPRPTACSPHGPTPWRKPRGSRAPTASTSSTSGSAAERSTTVEFAPADDGTRLLLTEQGTFLDGHEDPAWREQGTGCWLDALGAYLLRTAPVR